MEIQPYRHDIQLCVEVQELFAIIKNGIGSLCTPSSHMSVQNI